MKQPAILLHSLGPGQIHCRQGTARSRRHAAGQLCMATPHAPPTVCHPKKQHATSILTPSTAPLLSEKLGKVRYSAFTARTVAGLSGSQQRSGVTGDEIDNLRLHVDQLLARRAQDNMQYLTAKGRITRPPATFPVPPRNTECGSTQPARASAHHVTGSCGAPTIYAQHNLSRGWLAQNLAATFQDARSPHSTIATQGARLTQNTCVSALAICSATPVPLLG
jgi:hypothetical protein